MEVICPNLSELMLNLTKLESELFVQIIGKPNLKKLILQDHYDHHDLIKRLENLEVLGLEDSRYAITNSIVPLRKGY